VRHTRQTSRITPDRSPRAWRQTSAAPLRAVVGTLRPPRGPCSIRKLPPRAPAARYSTFVPQCRIHALLDGIPPSKRALSVVDSHLVLTKQALRIDQDFHAILLVHFVRGALFGVELELIAQPRAPATQNTQAKPSRDPFPSEGLLDFVDSLRSHLDHVHLTQL